MIVEVIGIGIGIGMTLMPGKFKVGLKKRTKQIIGIGMVAVMGGALMYGGFTGLKDKVTDVVDDIGIQTVSGEKLAEITSCDSQTSPDLKILAHDLDNPKDALTTSSLYRQVGTTSWTSFTPGTAIADLEVGADYEVVLGITTTDSTDLSFGNYFFVDNLECKPTVIVDVDMRNDEVESGLSATFYNENHDASAQVMTAGQSKTVFLKFESAKDEVYGNPYIGGNSNVLCLDLNSSSFDKPESVRYNGQELARIATPLRHTPVASDQAYCYEAPIVEDTGVEIEVKLKADDTNAPTEDEIAFLYSSNWYIDDNGDVQSGVEDEDGNAVGTDAPDQLTIDLT